MEWLTNLLEAELLALQMGHLPYSPNDDKFDGTLGYWVESFTTSIGKVNDGDVEIDRQRIKRAFKKIRPTLEAWPTPFQVLAIMESRPPQNSIGYEHRHEDGVDPNIQKMTKAICDLTEGTIDKEEFDRIMEQFAR